MRNINYVEYMRDSSKGLDEGKNIKMSIYNRIVIQALKPPHDSDEQFRKGGE